MMMAAFNVTTLAALGYDFSSTQQYADPQDSRFSAQQYSDAAYAPDAVHSAVSSLAALSAYNQATSLSLAEASYYSTAGYHGDAYTPSFTTTARATHSGFGFPQHQLSRPATSATAAPQASAITSSTAAAAAAAVVTASPSPAQPTDAGVDDGRPHHGPFGGSSPRGSGGSREGGRAGRPRVFSA